MGKEIMGITPEEELNQWGSRRNATVVDERWKVGREKRWDGWSYGGDDGLCSTREWRT